MVDVRITDLPDLPNDLADADLAAVVQGSTTYKASGLNFRVGAATGVAAGTVPMKAVDGTLGDSSITEADESVMVSKPFADIGSVLVGNWQLSNGGSTILVTDMAQNRFAYPIASLFDPSTGSDDPFYTDIAQTTTTSTTGTAAETFTGSQIQFKFQISTAGRRESYVFDSAATSDVTDCNLIVRASSHTDTTPIFDYKRATGGTGFTLGSGNTTITLPVPQFFEDNQIVYITIAAGSGQTLELRGETQTIDGTQETVPHIDINFRETTNFDIVTRNTASTEYLQDLVAAMFTGGTHQGITVTYDDVDGTIDLEVTGTTPPIGPSPAFSNFSINVPATVNVGTDLNTARVVTYNTQGTTDIASIVLVVTVGNNVNLTVPSADGTHTANVTLSGISTASAGTVTFQLQGTTTGGATIMSSTQTVTIRAVTADEQAYYGVRATNDFATVDTALLTAVDVQPPGTQYTISGSWPATQFIGILEPTDRPITSIIETAFNAETLSTWTRTASARTINGQAYDLLTQENNGPSGNFEFRVTHG